MLHAMRNTLQSETDLLEQVVRRLTRELPARWRFEIRPPRPSAMVRPDAVLEIRVGREVARLEAEVKARLLPGQLRRLVESKRLRPRETILVTTFFSRATQALLTERDLNYADATGNTRITLDKPALYLSSQGATQEPGRSPRPLRTLRGRIAGRAVRALCDFKPPFGIRELAIRSGTSAAMISRVADVLDREGLLERSARGTVETVSWQRLLQRWAEEYRFDKSNRAMRYLALRGFDDLKARLQRSTLRYAITGSLAANEMRPVAPAVLASIYSEDPVRLAGELDLEAVETQTNVLLVQPFDEVVFDRTVEKGSLVYAAPTQVVVDLLTSPGRGPEEADALMKWMVDRRDVWQS